MNTLMYETRLFSLIYWTIQLSLYSEKTKYSVTIYVSWDTIQSSLVNFWELETRSQRSRLFYYAFWKIDERFYQYSNSLYRSFS